MSFYKSKSFSTSDSLWKQTNNTTIAPIGQSLSVNIPNDLTVNGSITNPSDMKLKENIVRLSDENKNNIRQLQPVEYNYKSDDNKRTHFGFIAQEMEKIYPNLVKENCRGKTVNYIELIPLLIDKINSLETEVFELKEQFKKKFD